LAIEYDGGNHRDRLVEDHRRQNGLINAGLRLLRFTAADVYGNPDLVAMQVRHALAARHSGTNGRIRAGSTATWAQMAGVSPPGVRGLAG
jgi:very-short-patch-repair endonuclease